MSRPPSSHRGASDRWIPSIVGPGLDPERERDLALARDAHAMMARRLRAGFAIGRPTQVVIELHKLAKGCCECLDGYRHTLSPRQRAVLLRIVGLDVLPPLPTGPAPKLLPLKPPRRIVREEESDGDE